MPQSSPPLFSVRRSASILALALIAALGLFSSEVWAQSAREEKPSNLTAQVVAAGIQLNWNAPEARAAGNAVQVVAESTDLPADIDTPGVVEVGVISRGEIEEVGDADWFRVSLNASVTYQIDMEGLWTGYADSSGTWVGVGTLVDPLLSAIYDASGQLIPGSGDQTEEGNGGTGQNSRTVFTPASSGDYFIEATATSAWRGTYVLIVTELE